LVFNWSHCLLLLLGTFLKHHSFLTRGCLTVSYHSHISFSSSLLFVARSSLDKVRDKMAEAMQNAGRGRLRKTASNLVLGKGTTGNFSVIMANDLCEAEDEELGTENNGDEEEYEEYLPKAKVYTYRERHGCCKGEEKINKWSGDDIFLKDGSI